MLTLGGACAKAGGLTSLRSFTLTIRLKNSTDALMDGTELLLRGSSLEVFQIFMHDSGSLAAPADQFFVRIIDQHRDHLVRFSFHRPSIGLDVIDHVCTSCSWLEELFIVINHTDMVYFPFSLFWEYILYLHENYQELLLPILARATHLRTVHIQIVNRPLELFCRAFGHALEILGRCSPTISQVGIDTNVWKAGLLLVTVTRSLIIDPGGKMYIDSEGYSGVEAVSHHSQEPGYTRTTPRSSPVEKKEW